MLVDVIIELQVDVVNQNYVYHLVVYDPFSYLQDSYLQHNQKNHAMKRHLTIPVQIPQPTTIPGRAERGANSTEQRGAEGPEKGGARKAAESANRYQDETETLWPRPRRDVHRLVSVSVEIVSVPSSACETDNIFEDFCVVGRGRFCEHTIKT